MPNNATKIVVPFNTQRMCIRYFTDDDAAFILELLNTDNWINNIGDRNVASVKDAQQYLERTAYHTLKVFGHTMMAMELNEDKKVIGMIGLFQRPNLQHADLGFAILPAYEGEGYAHEAAQGAINYAFETLKMEVLAAITTADNTRSRKLLTRLNFIESGLTTYNDTKENLLLYELHKARLAVGTN
jgi:[ribosomal protein S5]-alanine N-acetyltransferase